MSALGDSIRAKAADLISIAADVDALGAAPTVPTGVDCLGGTWPPSGITYPISYPAGDTDGQPVLVSYYNRKMAHCPDGTVTVLGDSLVQDMVDWKVHPFAQCFGKGGESFRRLFNRMTSGGLIYRSGCMVILSGINDLCNFAGNGALSTHVAKNNLAFMHGKLASAATGKWVICDLLPADEPFLVSNHGSDYSGLNAEITSTNADVRAAWLASAATVSFVDVKASLVDGNGDLADVNHIDGMHLSRAGHNILAAGINTAVSSLV